jgi:hypothetical protein
MEPEKKVKAKTVKEMKEKSKPDGQKKTRKSSSPPHYRPDVRTLVMRELSKWLKRNAPPLLISLPFPCAWHGLFGPARLLHLGRAV